MRSARSTASGRTGIAADRLTGIDQTRELVETFAKYLDDPMTFLPPPVLANGWEGYYHIMHYEGDRTADTQ